MNFFQLFFFFFGSFSPLNKQAKTKSYASPKNGMAFIFACCGWSLHQGSQHVCGIENIEHTR